MKDAPQRTPYTLSGWLSSAHPSHFFERVRLASGT